MSEIFIGETEGSNLLSGIQGVRTKFGSISRMGLSFLCSFEDATWCLVSPLGFL
jgi:hypothetical protein